MASLAVAASVAFVVVIGVGNNPGEVTNDGFAQQTQTPLTQPNVQLASQDAQQAEILAANELELTPAELRLKALIDQHTEQATLSRGGSFMPHAQAVSHSE